MKIYELQITEPFLRCKCTFDVYMEEEEEELLVVVVAEEKGGGGGGGGGGGIVYRGSEG